MWNSVEALGPPAPVLLVAKPVNPEIDGFRSFMSPGGSSLRDHWPLPKSASAHIHSETNCEGCSKTTIHQIAHSQRSAIWFSFCMVHETIIEFHIIKNGEGRRDCIIPLYRFLETPPEAVFCDVACFCEDSSMK